MRMYHLCITYYQESDPHHLCAHHETSPPALVCAPALHIDRALLEMLRQHQLSSIAHTNIIIHTFELSSTSTATQISSFPVFEAQVSVTDSMMMTVICLRVHVCIQRAHAAICQ